MKAFGKRLIKRKSLIKGVNYGSSCVSEAKSCFSVRSPRARAPQLSLVRSFWLLKYFLVPRRKYCYINCQSENCSYHSFCLLFIFLWLLHTFSCYYFDLEMKKWNFGGKKCTVNCRILFANAIVKRFQQMEKGIILQQVIYLVQAQNPIQVHAWLFVNFANCPNLIHIRIRACSDSRYMLLTENNWRVTYLNCLTGGVGRTSDLPVASMKFQEREVWYIVSVVDEKECQQHTTRLVVLKHDAVIGCLNWWCSYL